MKKAILAATAAFASLILAKSGWAFRLRLGVMTPGMRASEFLLPRSASILAYVALQLSVDFVFWFALMWALYWLFGRLERRFGKS
jgi:hypothetical protein